VRVEVRSRVRVNFRIKVKVRMRLRVRVLSILKTPIRCSSQHRQTDTYRQTDQ
jgi:hypothetical protein